MNPTPIRSLKKLKSDLVYHVNHRKEVIKKYPNDKNFIEAEARDVLWSKVKIEEYKYNLKHK